MVTLAKKRKLAGFVIDGAIRDQYELMKLGFPVFARGISPNGPYKNGPGEINVPVYIGGRVIHPGDIIVGDLDGVISINPNEAETVLQNALLVMQKEQAMLKDIEKNNHLDLEWMYKKLEFVGCESIK